LRPAGGARYALLLLVQEVQRRSLIFRLGRFATRDARGAQALGMPEQSGALQEGLQADSRSFRSPARTKFPVYDPVGALIFSSNARDVVLTGLRDGKFIGAGRVTNVDEDRLRARMRRNWRKISRGLTQIKRESEKDYGFRSRA